MIGFLKEFVWNLNHQHFFKENNENDMAVKSFIDGVADWFDNRRGADDWKSSKTISILSLLVFLLLNS